MSSAPLSDCQGPNSLEETAYRLNRLPKSLAITELREYLPRGIASQERRNCIGQGCLCTHCSTESPFEAGSSPFTGLSPFHGRRR